MNLIVMGPPGAGKGTQAQILAKRCGLTHLSSGDILRDEVKKQSKLGVDAQSYMVRGALVPDEIMISMILGHALDVCRSGGSFLLDGFPRTVAQAEALDLSFLEEGISIEGIVNFDVDNQTIVRRLTGRMVCPNCKKVYHSQESAPKMAGFCDDCPGVKLLVREDDTEAVVLKRLDVYDKTTRPVLNFYADKRKVVHIDGRLPKDVVARHLEEFTDSLGSSKVF